MGNEYLLEEKEELVEDLIRHAAADKVGINAWIPGVDQTKANSFFGEIVLKKDNKKTGAKKGDTVTVQFGWKSSFIEELSETHEPSLMVSTNSGWPAPYLAFFDPKAKQAAGGYKREKSKYARK